MPTSFMPWICAFDGIVKSEYPGEYCGEEGECSLDTGEMGVITG